MAVVEELLRSEKSGAISFGNHKLEQKAKVEDFQHAGDLLKVKTYRDITKLEKNGMFLYESVPGTSVLEFTEKENGVEFIVEGDEEPAVLAVDVSDGAGFQEGMVAINLERPCSPCAQLRRRWRRCTRLKAALVWMFHRGLLLLLCRDCD